MEENKYKIGDLVTVIEGNEFYYASDKPLEVTGTHPTQKFILLDKQSYWIEHYRVKPYVVVEKEEYKPKKLEVKEYEPKTVVLTNYKMGCELECYIDYDYQNDWGELELSEHGFEQVSDGSLEDRDNGIELRTVGGQTYQKFKTNVKYITEQASQYELQITSACGYHFHLSNPKFMDKTFIKRLVFFWSAIEDFLISTQPNSRLNNQYCKRFLQQYLRDEKENVTLPEAKVELVNQLAGIERYKTLNLSAMKEHGTIEIRLHSGTLNSKKIMAWADLMIAVFDYCLKDYKHTDVVALFENEISEVKIQKIYEVLRLNKDLTTYLDTRIRKLMFAKLALQQKSALKITTGMKKLKTASKKYEESKKTYDAVNQAFQTEFRNLERG